MEKLITILYLTVRREEGRWGESNRGSKRWKVNVNYQKFSKFIIKIFKGHSQLIFTHSKSTIEALEKGGIHVPS